MISRHLTLRILQRYSGMTNKPPTLRPPTRQDFTASLTLGWRDFIAAPLIGFFFAGFFAGAGLLMAWITYLTGQTFWLVLAVLGFPLIGTLSAVGFYETSRRRAHGGTPTLGEVARHVWHLRKGQLPWLATIIIVIFLFWFFLGHMIFALFLGLSPMTNVSTSLDVFFTAEGLSMIAVGSLVGAVFATLVFSLSVHGIPMLLDRDIDFITAMLRSISAVVQSPLRYLLWGVFVGVVTLVSMVPLFAGLFITMPVLGHTTWHLYKRLCED